MSDVKKTLFEAACAAEDGARFKVGPIKFDVMKSKDDLVYVGGDCDGQMLIHPDLRRTDFEQLPSGPKKRDATIFVEGFYVPTDVFHDTSFALDIMSGLLKWEGAQIGKPGYVMKPGQFGNVFIAKPSKIDVTFQTAEQCEAAWKAECPDMFAIPTNP